MTPFAPGSVSVGLHPSAAAPATEQAEQLVAEAAAAERAGFDGVTMSEHHAGFPGYLPQPLLALTWMLAAVTRVWAAPAPVLLGLRSPRLLAEELAWTAARFPGRIGAAMAAGYAESDFDAVGVPTHGRSARFDANLTDLLDAIETDGPLAADPAISAGLLPVEHLLLAVNSRAAARRAAAAGLGILFPGGEPPERLGGLAAEYRQAGGAGPVVGIAVVWLGDERVATDRLDAHYLAAARPGTRQATGFRRGPFSGGTSRVVDELIGYISAAGLTSVNLRLRADDATSAAVLEQIELVGGTVIPDLRQPLQAAAGRTSGTELGMSKGVPDGTGTE